jgi:peroxiredoxin
MALTPSTMVELGTPAPDFSLPDTDGILVSRDDFKSAEALVVLFICNHCPYVKHIAEALAQFARDYQPRNVAVVAINSNDALKYPDDSPEKMKEAIIVHRYTFPYLFDQSQSVAKAYRAACTPDIYVFDKNRRLVYRGQFDSSRPGKGTATGADLRAAVDAVLAGKSPNSNQIASMGCNIKWKPGNEPDYR